MRSTRQRSRSFGCWPVREHKVDQFLDVTHCAPGTDALRCHMPRASRPPPFLGATVNVTIAATGGEDPTEEFVSWY